MKIILFLCAGLALGGCDKLDRTYLPPPESKFSGGSPGAILGPLEYPKEMTFPTSGPTEFIEQSPNNRPVYSQRPFQEPSAPANGYGVAKQQNFQSPGQIGRPINLKPQSNLPGLPQGPFNPSVQNGNRFNLPSTTTSYAFSQTTTYPPSEGDFETSTGPIDIYGQEFDFRPIPSQNPSNIYQNNGLIDESPIPEVPILQKLPGGTPINRPGFMQRPQNNVIVNPAQSNLINPQVNRNQRPLQSGKGAPNLSQGYVPENTLVNAKDRPTTYQPPFISPNLPQTSGSTIPGSRNQYSNIFPSMSPITQNIQGQYNPLQGNKQTNQVSNLANNENQFAPNDISTSNNPFYSDSVQNQNLPSPSTSAQSSISSSNQPIQGTLPPSNEELRVQGSLNTPTGANRLNEIPIGTTSFASSNVSSISPSSYNPILPGYIGDQTQQKNTPTNRPQRVQAEADRNAVILNYEASITPDGDFSYSFDTSNGIHADESGTAADGVKAKGSYSYIGDDGKLYKVVYTADENGFRPQGDHLPTPPPIPEAILRVIDQANRDKEAGIIHDGSYDEEKYGYKKYAGLMDHVTPQIKKNNELSLDRPNSFRDVTVANANIKNIDSTKSSDSGNNKISDATLSRQQLQPKQPIKTMKNFMPKIISSGQSKNMEINDGRLSSTNRPSFKNDGRPSQNDNLNKTKTQNQFDEEFDNKRPISAYESNNERNKEPFPYNDNKDTFITRNKLNEPEYDLTTENENITMENNKIGLDTRKPTNYPYRKQQNEYKNGNTQPELHFTENNMHYHPNPNEGKNTGQLPNDESFKQYSNKGNTVTKTELPNINIKESGIVNQQPIDMFEPYIGTENQYLPITDSNDYDLLEETDFNIQQNAGTTTKTPFDNQLIDEKDEKYFIRKPQNPYSGNKDVTFDNKPLRNPTNYGQSTIPDLGKGSITATDMSILNNEETGYDYSRPQQVFNQELIKNVSQKPLNKQINQMRSERPAVTDNISNEFVSDKDELRRPIIRPSLRPQHPILSRPNLANTQENVRPRLPINQQFPPYANNEMKIKTQFAYDTTQRPFGDRIPTTTSSQNYPAPQRTQYNDRRVPTLPGRTTYPGDETNPSTTPMSPELPSKLGSVDPSTGSTYPINQNQYSTTASPFIVDSTSPADYTDRDITKGLPTTKIPPRLNGITKNGTNVVQAEQKPSNNQVPSSNDRSDYPGTNYGFNPDGNTSPQYGARDELYRRPSQNNAQKYSTTQNYPKEQPTYQPNYSTPSFNNNPTDPSNNVFSTANPEYQGDKSQEFITPSGGMPLIQGPTDVPFSSRDQPTGNSQQFNTPYSGGPQGSTFVPYSSQNQPSSDSSPQYSKPFDVPQGLSDVPFSTQYQNNYPTTSRTPTLDYNEDFPATGINTENQNISELTANYQPGGQSTAPYRPQEAGVNSESSVDLRPYKETNSAPDNINREDFSGARRPQYFDPITGYHY